jgi:predicted metal-dependent HD superfamily phosphohydrolase
MIPLFDKWSTFLKAHNVTESPIISFTELVNRHAIPQRFYHTFSGHIVMVMDEFEPVRDLCNDPLAVEGALFTHDVVYDSRAKDNEEQSAIWMDQFFGKLGMTKEYRDRVGHLIADASKTHVGIPGDTDRNIFISCDLAILGQPWDVYCEYARNVEREYAWVDKKYGENTRRSHRFNWIGLFLQREKIFPHEYFHQKYEKNARNNLWVEMQVLRPSKSVV